MDRTFSPVGKKIAALTIAVLLVDHSTFAAGPADSAKAANLIKQGQDAFDAGDLNQARDAFEGAIAADPKNSTAGRDLGIVYLRLDQATKAAHPLEIASAAKNPDRSLVLALAAQHVDAKSPMQAAKVILVYFDAHPTPVDEELLNALGIALAQADAMNIKSSLVTDASRTYKKLNTKLEATRAGDKRWGQDWQPAADVDTKQSTVTSAQTTIRLSTAAIAKLDAQIAATQRQKDAVLYTEGNNNQTQKKDAFQKQIDQLNVERDKQQKDLDEANKTLADTLPKWPEAIPVDHLTLSTDASPSAAATPAPKSKQP